MSEEQQQSSSGNSTPSDNSGNGYSQTEIIDLLQKTIQQLDRVVSQLNSTAIASLPSKTVVENIVANTEALAASLSSPSEPETIETPTPTETSLAVPEPTITEQEEEIEEFSPSEEGWIDRILPSFNSLQNWWDGVLNKIRSLLPASLQEKLSDWVLTGILAGIVVTVLLTSVLLLPQQPTAEIVEIPPTTAPEITPETPSEEVPKVVETPPELKAPGSPKPVEIIPPPEPELTPEQSLIAAIQDRVAAITNQYPEGLVLSVEANFLGSRLIVTMGDNWYSLSPSRQERLVNSIFDRTRNLDFRKLDIVDAQGTILARNPVVGNKMVILKREA